MLFAPQLVRAQSNDALDASAAKRAAEASRELIAQADAYQLQLDGPDQRISLTRTAESVLRWSNTASGEIYGEVFLWTRDGIPQALGSFHQWYSPHQHSSNEFHSFSKHPLRALRDGNLVWAPTVSGVRWQSIGGAAGVGSTATQRLVQMRAFARSIQIKKTDREGRSSMLRALSQPIYRVPVGESSDWADGAVFAFVQGTDPEAMLLIRALPNAGWQFAFARLNSVQLQATRDNHSIWTAEQLQWSLAKDPSQPYVLVPVDRVTVDKELK
ncbi:hypothetical protein [Stieleria tagensis]|uniref:hypothetical protein n=1 Tax=Stieleria tagensis TaxID=2956795 RepID=UPI00209B483F|nr:hypothetical protein [Stieleria tagensis]